jgi:Zn-dependent protease
MNDLAALGQGLSVWLLPVVTAITLHEAAHAWVADRLGDDTARMLGRVSFNPIRHIDPFGTLFLPGMLLLGAVLSGVPPLVFGWAKPVPVAFHRLNNPKRDMVWVALAGPGINIALALMAGLLLQLIGQLHVSDFNMWVWENVKNAILANVVLACFNMLPIPPLDGGRVVTGLLPVRYAIRFAQLERYGLLIVMGIFLVPFVAGQAGFDFNPLAMVLWPVVQTVHGFVLVLTGWA